MFARSIIVVSLLAGAAAAQGSTIQLFDGSYESHSRGGLGTLAAECLTRVPKSHFGHLQTLRAVTVGYHDTWGTNSHSFEVVVRTSSTSGAPDLSANGLLLRQKATSRRDWRWTHAVNLSQLVTLPKPLPLPDDSFFVGVRFFNQTNGGLSMLESPKSAACGERARTTTQQSWIVSYLGPNPWMTKLVSERAWYLYLHTGGPAVQPYARHSAGQKGCSAKTASFNDRGHWSMWPDPATKPAFGWVIDDHTAPSGAAFLFVSCQKLPLAVPVPGIGRLWISPACFVLTTFTSLDAKGVRALPPVQLPAAVWQNMSGVTLYAQALTINQTSGKLRMSNWCATSF